MASVSYSALQHLLQSSYSANIEDQQKAAIELSRLAEGCTFPPVSFGPLIHAVSRLIPSPNRTVASYSARALKILLLDDTMRPQAAVAGVPKVVCAAIKQWGDEALCLRELLASLQTLCWDPHCVRAVLDLSVLNLLVDYIQVSDPQVSILALSTLANILYFSDTLLLHGSTEVVHGNTGTWQEGPRVVEGLMHAMGLLLQTVRVCEERPKRFYAAAAIANAAKHPRLAAALKADNCLEVFRELDRQSHENLHILGSKLGECTQTAIFSLTDGMEGDAMAGRKKYNFKWGTKSVMELNLIPIDKHRKLLPFALLIWSLIILYTFSPLLLPLEKYSAE